MNIAVYSGSFNPLHIGHLAILKHLTQEAGFDLVYLIVSHKNPLKDSISSDSATARFNAAVEAVNRHFSPASEVIVDDIELTMPEPHYTIRTLDALKERESETSFTFVLGSDNLADIRRWRDYSRILLEFGVVVYPRTGFDTEAVRQDLLKENPDYKIEIIDAELVDISSSEIREKKASGQDVSGWLM
jgi:nicotinate-nucleotide adenylyltransferase